MQDDPDFFFIFCQIWFWQIFDGFSEKEELMLEKQKLRKIINLPTKKFNLSKSIIWPEIQFFWYLLPPKFQFSKWSGITHTKFKTLFPIHHYSWLLLFLWSICTVWKIGKKKERKLKEYSHVFVKEYFNFQRIKRNFKIQEFFRISFYYYMANCIFFSLLWKIFLIDIWIRTFSQSL